MTVEISTGGPSRTCWPLSAAPNVTSPRRDAGPDDQPDAVARLQLVVERGQGALRFRRGLERPQRVVLVPERQPEHRDDRVADDLLDRAAMRLEHGAHDVEVAVQDLAQRLRIEPLAERRGALEVRRDEVMTRRTSPAASSWSSGEAHMPHSRASTGFVAPHVRHVGPSDAAQSSGDRARQRRARVAASGLRARGALRPAAAQVAQVALVRPREAHEVRRRGAAEALLELRVDQRVQLRQLEELLERMLSGPRAGPVASSAMTFAVRRLPVIAAISPKKSPGPIDRQGPVAHPRPGCPPRPCRSGRRTPRRPGRRP